MKEHPFATDDALRRRLLGLARFWLGDGSAAEDLLHDAYLRTASGDLPAKGPSQEAWLVTVVRNLCIDQLRRHGRYQAVLATAAEERVPDDERDQPDHLAAQAQRVDEALLRLVHHLPADDVAAVLLYEVFDFSHAELAALSGRSEAATRQRHHRMMSRLDRNAPVGGEEDDDRAALFALCQQALLQCETTALVTLVRTAAPQALTARVHAAHLRVESSGQAPSAKLAHLGNQMALLIQVGDGPVAWVPLGEAVGEVA